MKKYLPLLALAILAGFVNCKSIARDNVSIHPEIERDAHRVIVRPTESTIEIDTNTWLEGESHKGRVLFGLAFFEDRFVSPTLLNKEGYDSYTLAAINNAISEKTAGGDKDEFTKMKYDSFHVVKAREEYYVFPFKFLPIYGTFQVKVKGHPIKYKFLGPISEQKADEIYAANMSKDSFTVDIGSALYPAKEVKPAPACCK